MNCPLSLIHCAEVLARSIAEIIRPKSCSLGFNFAHAFRAVPFEVFRGYASQNFSNLASKAVVAVWLGFGSADSPLCGPSPPGFVFAGCLPSNAPSLA